MFATELNDELIDIIGAAGRWNDAQCLGSSDAEGSLWFSDHIPDIVGAKAICRTCSLIDPCLDGALQRKEPWGVWGGQLFDNGQILVHKRSRGRPPKNRPVDEDIALTA